ncbi:MULTISPECIES: NUDIX domain-containing protein [unclassified Sutcliffiella]|uniref:NUDIX domain-containing protein n=1 Tax=unclassified Sutcliffiella TaxID=2837532 RepID=UPI0030CD9827
MKLRQLAVAFIINEEYQVLFLQKKSQDTFLAGHLVPIGGHIEGIEINEPKNACLREIEEETGINRNHLHDLTLRYIVHRTKAYEEIRIQYVFFGTLSKQYPLVESDEGSLKWIEINEVANKNVSATTIEIINHFIKKMTNNNVFVGSMKSQEGEPIIKWAELEDWEMPIS